MRPHKAQDARSIRAFRAQRPAAQARRRARGRPRGRAPSTRDTAQSAPMGRKPHYHLLIYLKIIVTFVL